MSTTAVPAEQRFQDLSNRTVLITGASSGIGRHFAKTAAGAGARVVLAARRKGPLEALAGEIPWQGGQALAVEMDVTDEGSTIAAFDKAEAAFGAVDSVIANAGMSVPGSVLGLAVEDFDHIVAVNLRGVFLTVREGARRMVAANAAERRHGRIVIISSVTAHHVSPGQATYSATKAAVTQFGRVVARDWAEKGINVNMIAPGYMETELTDGFFESKAGLEVMNRFPRRRIMDIDALDAMLLYLSCDASAAVTGSVFTIDDGQTL